MRILSQNRMIDLPYENVGVSINHNDSTKIVAYPAGNYNKEFGSWKMAEYSTETKARKALEMLRNAYSPNIKIKEPIQKEMPKLRSGDWVWTVSEPKVEVLDNFYFQFPQDSEMEV